MYPDEAFCIKPRSKGIHCSHLFYYENINILDILCQPAYATQNTGTNITLQRSMTRKFI